MHFVEPKKLNGLHAFPPGGRTILTLRENLDSAGAPILRERLIDVLHRGTGLLILDLSQVPSCDTAGLAVLVATQRRAGLLGVAMRLVAPSLAVSKVLSATGLKRHFAISSEIDDVSVAAVRAMVLDGRSFFARRAQWFRER